MTEGQRSYVMLGTKFWYAVYTKPRWEKKMSKKLFDMGIENYCPLTKVERQWSDRKTIILEPIFKTYLFVKIEADTKWDLKKIPGIINFVHWLGKPAIIKEDEILRIKKFLNEFGDSNVETEDIKVNDKVLVTQGVLMDHEGLIVHVHGKKARIKIESLGIFLSTEIDKKNLKLLPTQ